MRTVIIHNHLFKNAGVTFDWSLRRNFGDRFKAHADDAKIKVDAAYLGAYLTENKGLVAVSSHLVQFPMPDLEGVRILPALMLRDPIDRVGSVYAFLQRQRESTPNSIKAKQTTFAQYVQWGMNPSSGAPIRNFQTRRCCGYLIHAHDQVNQQDFEAALRQLRDLSLMGRVERYDESMVVFEHTLRPYFPEINLAYVKQNVSQNRKGTLEERVQHVYDRLGSELSALLIEQNKWDQTLITEADAVLSERIEAVPAFEKKLKKFRQRCRRLRALSKRKRPKKYQRYMRKLWTGIRTAPPDR